MTKYLEDFNVYIGRMREIAKEANELSAHLELQSARLKQYEERVHAGKQGRAVGILSADTMQLLEDELDDVTELQDTNRAKVDELDIELAHVRSVIYTILEDASRDLAIWEETGEMSDELQCGGDCQRHSKRSDR